MQEFINRLNTILNERDITQKELAKLANTTEATVSRYLTGERLPKAVTIVAFAQALNVSTDYLLGLSAIKDTSGLSAEMSDLLECYEQANENDKKVIWAVLDKYKHKDIKVAAVGQDTWKKTDKSEQQKALRNFEE